MLEIMDHIRTEDWMALELDSYQADVLDDVTVVMEEAISSNLTYPNHLNNSAILGESLTFIATRNKGCSRPCLTGTVPTTERPERRVADKVEHFLLARQTCAMAITRPQNKWQLLDNFCLQKKLF